MTFTHVSQGISWRIGTDILIFPDIIEMSPDASRINVLYSLYVWRTRRNCRLYASADSNVWQCDRYRTVPVELMLTVASSLSVFFNCSSGAGLSWLKLLQGESLVRQVDHSDTVLSCWVFFPSFFLLFILCGTTDSFFYWGEECNGLEWTVGIIDNLWVCAPARDCIVLHMWTMGAMTSVRCCCMILSWLEWLTPGLDNTYRNIVYYCINCILCLADINPESALDLESDAIVKIQQIESQFPT